MRKIQRGIMPKAATGITNALKQVKDHFSDKVQKVVQAKEYQIKCQKIIAIDAAKKIVSETTKDSSELFNQEVTTLMHQY